jgi:hypothetical protein
MGKRMDTVFITENVIFVMEVKVREKVFLLGAMDRGARLCT